MRPNITSNTTTKAPVQQTQQTNDAQAPRQSRLENLTDMKDAAQKLYLPDIDEKQMNIPAFVQSLSQEFSLDHKPAQSEHTDFAPISQTDLNNDVRCIQHAIHRTLDTFLHLLQKRSPALPKELLQKANELLHKHSDFRQYFDKLPNDGLRVLDFGVFTLIINKTREICGDLHNAPVSVIESAFNHFPPRNDDFVDELKCFAGMLDRLEVSCALIRHDLQLLNLRTGNSLLEALNREAKPLSQLMADAFIKANFKTGFSDTISEEFEVHMVKGLFIALGVDPNTYEGNNEYAKTALDYTSGEKLYNTIVLALHIIKEQISETLKAPASEETLRILQRLMANATEQKLNTQNFKKILLEDGIPESEVSEFKSPLHYGLKKIETLPISLHLAKTGIELSQHFGQWDEYSTQLQGWNWSKLNQHIHEKLTDEFHLQTETIDLAAMSYHQVQGHFKYSGIHQAIFHPEDQNQQFFALQFLLNKMKRYPQEDRQKACFESFMILANDNFHQKHTHSPHFLSTLVQNKIKNATQDPKTSETVKHLFDALAIEVDHLFSCYPYNQESADDIINALRTFTSNEALSLHQFMLLMDYISIQSESIQIKLVKHINPLELQNAVSLIVNATFNNKSDAKRIYTHLLRIPLQYKQDLDTALVDGFRTQYRNLEETIENSTDIMQELLESKQSILHWFPQLLSNDTLHKNHEYLAFEIAHYMLLIENPFLIGHLLKSEQAVRNLKSMEFSADDSLLTLFARLEPGKMKKSFSPLVDGIPWDISHYLSPEGHVKDSLYFKTLYDFKNTEDLKIQLPNIRARWPEMVREIIQDFIIPVYTRNFGSSKLNYFNSLSHLLNHEEQQILGENRGLLLSKTLVKNNPNIDRQLLILVKSLPRTAITSIADFLFIHSVEARTATDNKLNRAFESLGVNTTFLKDRYPEAVSEVDNMSQFLFAASMAATTTEYGNPLSQGSGIGLLISERVSAETSVFFQAIGSKSFKSMCESAGESPARQIDKIIQSLSTQQKNTLKNTINLNKNEFENSFSQDMQRVLLQ